MADFPDEDEDIHAMLAADNVDDDMEDDEDALAVARESEEALLEENMGAKRKLFNTPRVDKNEQLSRTNDDAPLNAACDGLQRETSSPLAKRMRLQSPSSTPQQQAHSEVEAQAGEESVVAEGALVEPKKDFVLTRMPLEDECVRITSSDVQCSRSYYLRLKGDENGSFGNDAKIVSNSGKSFDRSRVNLCSVPYSKLCDEATAILAKSFSDETPNTECGNAQSHPQENNEQVTNFERNELWSEKHRPKSYNVLLSDDSTNRALLTWLRLWDKIVFNKDFKLREKKSEDQIQQTFTKGVDGKKENYNSINKSYKSAEASKGYRKNGNPSNNNGFVFKAASEADTLVKGLDKETGRPQQPVAMLHGPPGLGKTTLAHVIARHAGYSPVELNASDDRTLGTFKEKIESALMTKSINDNNTPKCLIIDEIDGAPANSINYLVQILNTNNEKSGDNGKRRKKKGGLLVRPVVCICNDVYTPSLRALRKIALLLPFRATATARLVTRLQQISRAESVIASATALRELALRSEGDIRSCLATLHFFKNNNINLEKSKKSVEFRMTDVLGANVGRKDDRKGLFALWKEVFEVPRTENSSMRSVLPSRSSGVGNTHSKKAGIIGSSAVSSLSSRCRQVLKAVQSCGGQYEKLMEGVFENYSVMCIKDHRLFKLRKCLDSLVFNDLIHKHISRSQSYSLMAYLPFSFVNIHLLCAATTKAKIGFPQTASEKRSAKQRLQNVVEGFFNGFGPQQRSSVVFRDLVELVIPYLSLILEPSLRPVNKTLYNSKERAEFEALLETMVGYNLSYVQHISPEGKYDFKLDPPILEVAHFPGFVHTSLPYIAKQLISREVDLQVMKRRHTSLKDENGKESVVPVRVRSKVTSSQSDSKAKPPALPSSLPSVRNSCPVDFFGRPIQTKSNLGGDKDKEKSVFGKSDIWFRFKEGHNNAVRKNIKIKDLL